jgi:adenylosuccinate lyase
VLAQLEVFPAAIEAENARHLPFLATTTILMEAVKLGAGRETAHEAIKQHAVAAAKALRNGGEGDLLSRLAGDRRVGLTRRKLADILAESDRFVGAAPHQVDQFAATTALIVKKTKGAADYRPARLL